MELTEEEEAMRAGECGPAVQWAIEHQIKVEAVVAKIAKPTGSKLVKGPAESGKICSVEVEEK
jgi:hypothetical protein